MSTIEAENMERESDKQMRDRMLGRMADRVRRGEVSRSVIECIARTGDIPTRGPPTVKLPTDSDRDIAHTLVFMGMSYKVSVREMCGLILGMLTKDQKVSS